MSNEIHLQKLPDRKDAFEAEQRLEQIITAACLAQPLLPAPASLHSRVVSAIERRASQWWRAPLRAWPSWAQAVLVLLCLCCAWLVTGSPLFAGNDASVQQWLFMPWMLADIFTSLLSVLRELLWLVLRISPVWWLLAMIISGVAVAMGLMGLSRLTTRHA
jgi:hypothetical protein